MRAVEAIEITKSSKQRILEKTLVEAYLKIEEDAKQGYSSSLISCPYFIKTKVINVLTEKDGFKINCHTSGSETIAIGWGQE